MLPRLVLRQHATPADSSVLDVPAVLMQIGVAGRTGCGKSTLMMALYRIGKCTAWASPTTLVWVVLAIIR